MPLKSNVRPQSRENICNQTTVYGCRSQARCGGLPRDAAVLISPMGQEKILTCSVFTGLVSVTLALDAERSIAL